MANIVLNHQFFFPYKTFLLGEYAVLEYRQALLIASKPGFSIDVKNATSCDAFGAIKQSLGFLHSCPIEREWQSCFEISPFRVMLQQKPLKGFGSSGAWMWTALILRFYFQHGIWPELDSHFFQKSMSYYFTLYNHLPKRRRPSGGDMASQYFGLCSHIDLHKLVCHKMSWPFIGIGFVLLSTGAKVQTYQHLSMASFTVVDLQNIFDRALTAWYDRNASVFIREFIHYQNTLAKQGLQHPNTTFLLEKVSNSSGFIAAKGCGALGAEVICVLYDSNFKQQCLDYYLTLDLHVIATDSDLSPGLSVTTLDG
ncbi:MAG: hypothetical protein VX112_00995 [Pseudomonadota bacterium]|nr:hypothetical protein [Pseudomonadota bacterium]